VFARLANYGPQPVDADVVLSVASLGGDASMDQSFQTHSVKGTARLLPARWDEPTRRAALDAGAVVRDSVDFKLELNTAAVIRIQHQGVEADALPADDTAYVVVPPPKLLSVALVTDGGNPFMERAIASLGLQSPKVLAPEDYESTVPSDHDVIVFDRHAPTRLPDAGNFVYFGSFPPVGAVRPMLDVQSGLPLFNSDESVLDWKRDHPILRGLNLSRLFIAESSRLDTPAEVELLIEGNKGPLALIYRHERRTHLLVAFDTLQSNWPLRETFPYFLYNTMQFLAAGSELNLRESFRPGDVVRLPRANLARLNDARSVTLVGPDTLKSIAVPQSGDLALPPFARTGLYRTDPVVPQFERFAVNLLDENESNVLPVQEPPGSIGTSVAASGEQQTRVEWWWWIVAAIGLPLLMIEWLVYTRRIHG
jgi:hypothetical protein